MLNLEYKTLLCFLSKTDQKDIIIRKAISPATSYYIVKFNDA